MSSIPSPNDSATEVLILAPMLAQDFEGGEALPFPCLSQLPLPLSANKAT